MFSTRRGKVRRLTIMLWNRQRCSLSQRSRSLRTLDSSNKKHKNLTIMFWPKNSLLVVNTQKISRLCLSPSANKSGTRIKSTNLSVNISPSSKTAQTSHLSRDQLLWHLSFKNKCLIDLIKSRRSSLMLSKNWRNKQSLRRTNSI